MTDHVQQIHEYLAAEASDEECRRLEAWMKEDESHVDLFVREALLHYQLREALREECSTPAPLDDEKDRHSAGDGAGGASTAAAPCLHHDEDQPPGMDPLPDSSVFRICGNTFSSWPAPVFGTLLVALLGLGGWYFGLGCLPTCKNDEVATVQELSACKWDKSRDDSTTSDTRVSLGRVLNLLEGTARVKFDCGAEVTLTGPALMKIDSDMDATLHHGDLSVNVPDEARGFLVHTSEMDVRDLGTEFTLNVDKQGQTKLEVVDGKVEASLPQKEDLRKKRNLAEGEYLRAGRSTLDEESSSQRLNVFRGVRVDFATMQGFSLLEIINENKDRFRHNTVNECLSVDTAWGSVFGSQGAGENLFLLPAPQNEDFDVVLSVAKFVPQRTSEHVGLLILDDTDNYSRMIYAMSTEREDRHVKFNVETDAALGQPVCEPVDFDNKSFQLRLMRRGSEISGWWSRDRKHWNLCHSATAPHAIRHVGFYASKGHPYPKNGTPYRQALIDEFMIEIKE